MDLYFDLFIHPRYILNKTLEVWDRAGHVTRTELRRLSNIHSAAPSQVTHTPQDTFPKGEKEITGKAAPRKAAEEPRLITGGAVLYVLCIILSFSFLSLSLSLPLSLSLTISLFRWPSSLLFVASCCPDLRTMSVSAGLSLPLRRMTVSNSLPSTLRFSPVSSRAFSTTLHRDATWGFIGLGQMGMPPPPAALSIVSICRVTTLYALYFVSHHKNTEHKTQLRMGATESPFPASRTNPIGPSADIGRVGQGIAWPRTSAPRSRLLIR